MLIYIVAFFHFAGRGKSSVHDFIERKILDRVFEKMSMIGFNEGRAGRELTNPTGSWVSLLTSIILC